jgi:hypothetical protein
MQMDNRIQENFKRNFRTKFMGKPAPVRTIFAMLVVTANTAQNRAVFSA